MKKKNSLLILTGLIVAALLPCCADLDPASPGPVNTGSVDFTRYVAIGNSLTAGYQSGGLVGKYQKVSYPALIARAAGSPTFEMPIISEPGIPPLLVINTIYPTLDLDTLDGQGTPINMDYLGIYNNLGIPGAKLNDLLTKGASELSNPFFGIVLRSDSLFGPNVVSQALRLRPTIATVWIGANDILGSVLMGSDQFMTSATSFELDYRALMDSLKAGCDALVAANLPDITSIPYATTVPPFLIDPETREPIINEITGELIPVIGLVQGVPDSLPPGTLVLLHAAPYIAQGIGVPLEAGGTGVPLDGSFIIDLTERQNIEERIGRFNGVIDSVCANRGIPVVDINAFFNDIGANGATIRGELFTFDYISGGLFSLDGVHPSTLGYYLVANEFIAKINESFGASIPGAHLPAAPLSMLPPPGGGRTNPLIDVAAGLPPDVFEDLKRIFGVSH